MIYLAEISAYNLTTSLLETLRFCTGQGYIDNVTNNYYEPRIEQPALMNREIFSDGRIGGASATGYGELTLINSDGGLDGLTGYAFDGRSLIIKVGEPTATYASFVTVLKATLSQAAFEWLRVSMRLKDRQAEFDKPLQANLYLGNNALPNGLEGVSDLKNQQKPKFYGRVSNMAPVLVNTSRLIYQINDGAIAELVNVLDKGAYLGRGADYVSQADMETTAPSAGQFRVWKAGGYFRLGSSAAGQITCTAWESATIESSTAAQVAYRIATGPGAIVAGDTLVADYTGLDSQNAGNVGLVVQSGQTIAAALDQLSASVGAWWGFNALGQFRMARLDLPTGLPVATFTADEILSIEREQTSINGAAVPVWKVLLTHDVNWTPQNDSSLAGMVPADRRKWLADASRQVSVEDVAIKAKHPLAQVANYDTVLAGPAVALPEATRRLTMLKGESHILTLTVRIDAGLLALLDLGVVVSVQHARFGLSAGKLYRIIKIQTDYQNNQLELRCWA